MFLLLPSPPTQPEHGHKICGTHERSPLHFKEVNSAVEFTNGDRVDVAYASKSSGALKIARFEWGVGISDNHLEYVKKPAPSKPRDRRLSPVEYSRLKAALVETKSANLEPVIDLAIETGMRRGELLKEKWRDLDLQDRTLQLYDTKNGEDRKVPLTMTATSILEHWSHTSERIFPVTDVAVRQAWDRLVKRAGITNLRFHDLRHEAISRFFEMGLSVPEIALISGHRDPRMLFRYTHLRAEDVVKKLS